jgi:hypothetical protein
MCAALPKMTSPEIAGTSHVLPGPSARTGAHSKARGAWPTNASLPHSLHSMDRSEAAEMSALPHPDRHAHWGNLGSFLRSYAEGTETRRGDAWSVRH